MNYTDEKYFEITEEGYIYLKDKYKNDASLKEIIIPNKINGINVKGIGEYAFCDIDSHIEKVILPEGVIEINDWAFFNCINLKEILLPISLKIIGVGVFSNCEKLKSIDIPDSVENIGDSCFSHSGIENIKLPDKIKDIEFFIFESSVNLKEIHIPKSVELIEFFAFNNCPNLKNVYIHNKNINIEKDAFDCSPNVKLIYLD